MISVIILNYNGKHLLKRFLPSINKLSYPNKEIIIVDNASSDDSVMFIKENYPSIHLVKNRINLGTAEGSNTGARAAKGKYVFWVSNDMEFEPDMLSYMVRCMEENMDIGICTCKMRRITEEGKRLNIIDSLGANIDYFGMPVSRGINQKDNGQFDYFAEVFFSFGGAMLIRKDIIDITGGYDEKTFTLADDIDLSWRVRLLGYKVVVEPKAVLYHRVSATLQAFGRERKRFISEKNTLRMLLKNYSLASLLWVLPGYFLLLFAEIIFFLLIGKYKIAFAGINAVSWNISNLLDTLKRRKIIQTSRKITDKQIFKLMDIPSHKIRFFIDYIRNPRSQDWCAFFGTKKTFKEKKCVFL